MCGYYWNFRGWNLFEELWFIIIDNNIDIIDKYELNKFRLIVSEYLFKLLNFIVDDRKVCLGRIYKLFLNGDGFIERKNNELFYFRVKENKGFSFWDIVNFEIGINLEGKFIVVNIKK